jgi:glycerol-3-phosphate dehydrogenase
MRALLLDSAAALRAASKVANIMAVELGQDQAWVEEQVRIFTELTHRFYQPAA